MIQDNTENIRKRLLEVLQLTTRNKVVKAIKETGETFHQYNLDRFIKGSDVRISTIEKIDKYLRENVFFSK